MPRLFRRDVPDQEKSALIYQLEEFKRWAAVQPELISFSGYELNAIGQHYGLSTRMLDFTGNPRIAAFFATHTERKPDGSSAAIFCLNSDAIDRWEANAIGEEKHYDIVPRMVRIGEPFHRVLAQEGTFVQLQMNDWLGFQMDVVSFPRTGPVSSPTCQDIYPKKKTPAELLVQNYLGVSPYCWCEIT